MIIRKTHYAIRFHEVMNDGDTPIGTIMYSMDGPHGPFHDMVTGAVDHCWEVLDALELQEDLREKKYQESQEELHRLLDSQVDLSVSSDIITGNGNV